MNRAARDVVAEVDLRSTKRRAYLSPVLHEQQYDYQNPADMKGFGIIDIRRLKDRIAQFSLVPSEEFDRRKTSSKNLVCIEDQSFLKKLRISAEIEGNQVVVHEMDSLTADGAWSVNLDASNLTLDSDFIVNGDAALNFDMDQAGTTTTAGYLLNSTMTSVNLSTYLNGSIFIYVYAPTITGLDSFTLRFGSSASNYYSKQVTVTNENLAFHTGLMLLRFDIFSATQTGTVDMTAINYLRLAIDKGNDSLQSTDWRVDYIVARRGIPHEVWYYTKYAWQNSAGTYIENSSASGDYLNADTDEYNLFVLKGKEILAGDLKNFDDAKEFRSQYNDARDVYINNNPSERLIMINEYHSFSSLDQTGDSDDDNDN